MARERKRTANFTNIPTTREDLPVCLLDYDEAAVVFGIGKNLLMEEAKKAKAVMKIGRRAKVDPIRMYAYWGIGLPHSD